MKPVSFFSHRLAILVALFVFVFGTAPAQQYVTFDVTPSVVDTTITFGLGDPFSATVGAFVSYSGDIGILGSLNLITGVPLAEPVPDWLGAYIGASLSTVISGNSSLSVSGYVGVTFNVTENFSFYVQTGPAAGLLPDPSFTFGGSAAAGAIYFF